MEEDVTKRNDMSVVKSCIYAFTGTAYGGLEVSTLDDDSMEYLQDNLRIIDPLYGVLRPMDIIQPYRLEMATRNVFPDNKSVKLASYWQPSITKRLSKEVENRNKGSILLNLASDEYSAAVDPKTLPEGTLFIKIVFREEGRVIAVHSKRARGLMARHVAESKAESLEDVKSFNGEGYAFVEAESDETTLVFDRKKQQAAKKRVPTSKPASAKKGAKKRRLK